MGILNMLKKSNIDYTPNHKWKKAGTNGWQYDIDSVDIDRAGRSIYILIRKFGEVIALEYDQILFQCDNSCYYKTIETMTLRADDEKRLTHDFPGTSSKFTQDSCIGIIYQDYQNEFGSKIFGEFDNQIRVVNDGFNYSYDTGNLDINYTEKKIVYNVTWNSEGDDVFWRNSIQNPYTEIVNLEFARYRKGQRVYTEYMNKVGAVEGANILFAKIAKNILEKNYPKLPANSKWEEIGAPQDDITYLCDVNNIRILSNNEIGMYLTTEPSCDDRWLYDITFESKDCSDLIINGIYAYHDGECVYALTKADKKLEFPLPECGSDEFRAGVKKYLLREIKSKHERALNLLPEGRDTLIADDFFFELNSPDRLERIFDGIIGLESVKRVVRNQHMLLLAEKRRAVEGQSVNTTQSLNMIFSGNPGTGKTMMARIVADLFKDMGILSKRKLIETDRSGLVAEYIGQTAPKVKEVFEKAIGGVLFIDEAYSLQQEGKDFGSEAIAELIKLMEDHAGEVVVILAGYKKEMSDFLSMNSGLKSRFPLQIDFPDYSIEELARIIKSLLRKKGFNVSDDLTNRIESGLQMAQIDETSGNGRLARNLVEEIMRNQAYRIAGIKDCSKEDLLTILAEDIPARKKQEEVDLEKEFDGIVGLDEVKEYVRKLDKSLKVNKVRADMGLENQMQTLHMIFKGNPGTGKTTIARIMAKMLYSIGFISTNNLVEVSRTDLVGEYIGQTAPKTEKVVKSALGGVLFIDEAYMLYNGSGKDYGKEALATLMKMMEDYRENIVVILAGYSDEMDKMLDVNPGIRSRFPNEVIFPDYSLQDLVIIAQNMYKDKDYILDDNAVSILEKLLQNEKSQKGFGNARTVRNIVDKSILQQNQRVAMNISNITKHDLMMIKEEDFCRCML